MKTWQTLGYLGLIPFIISLYLSKSEIFLSISAEFIFIAYSAVILSFIAGSLWRVDTENTENKTNIISNIFCLTAFFSLIIPANISLIVLALGYICVLVYECSLVKQRSTSTNYISMRFWLTVSVILLHISAYITWGY